MTARSIAIARIARAARRFPDISFRFEDPAQDTAGLDARDAALAGAIEHNVLRRWITLVAVVQTQLSRPWTEIETRLQAALLCGTAQLLLMDRLPDYAVIDETVDWAKENVRPKAGGLVNAVLRKVAALRNSSIESDQPSTQRARRTTWDRNELPLHDGRVLTLASPVFAEHALTRLSHQTSHPLELLEHWIGLFGTDRAASLAAHSLVHAPIILHNIDIADATTMGLAAHEQAGFHVLESHGHAPVQDVLTRFPHAIVQDPSSAASVNATRSIVPSPRCVIDACAGRGTKTRQLALTHADAQIIATDVDLDRLESLRATFKGHERVRVVEHRSLTDFVGMADLILLDVPCSNTGVLARRVEAKHRFTRASVRSLIDIQRQIAADALRMLADRGTLAYTTCSIDPAENQQQARWITQWHPLEIVAEHSTEPAGLPGDSATTYHDGGYWALLRKKSA